MAGDPLPSAPDVGRLSAAELSELRDRLAVAGFDDDGGGPGMGLAPGQVDAARLPLVLAALRDRADTGALLARVFAYGDAVPAGELEAAVGPTTIDRLAGCNLIHTANSGELACPLMLRPLAGLIVASDRAGHGDAVMPPGPTTVDLARALPRGPLGRVLDVGTGSGVLALLAAGRGAAVTATDINDRACSFTRFNAAFNGLAVEVRGGDLFTPVAGEQFDLVLCQPPFVVQPEGTLASAYVHGGPRGDELALRTLAGLDGVLAPDAVALMRFDCPGTQDDVVRRARAMVPGDLDLAVFGFATIGPDLIALTYAAVADPSLGPRYRAEVARYHRHLGELGFDRFTGTVTVVQRPAEQRPGMTLSVAGRAVPRWPYIVGRLAAERLASAPEFSLLSARLSPMPHAHLAAELGLDQADLNPSYKVRYPSGSVPMDLELNQAGAAMLQLFAGGREMAAVIGAYADATEMTPDEAALDVIAFARDALRRGLLVPSVG